MRRYNTNSASSFTASQLWKDALAAIIGMTLIGCGAQASTPQCDPLSIPQARVSTVTDVSRLARPDVVASTDVGPVAPKALKETIVVLPPERPLALAPTKEAVKPVVKPTPLVKPQTFKVTGKLGVVESAMGTGVENRTPLGVSTRFDTEVGKVWAFIKVKNRLNPMQLKMVWKRGDTVRANYDIRVGKSYGWRTWGTKRIGRRDTGDWTVELHTPDGKVLHKMAFKIVSVPRVSAAK